MNITPIEKITKAVGTRMIKSVKMKDCLEDEGEVGGRVGGRGQEEGGVGGRVGGRGEEEGGVSGIWTKE